MTLGAARKTIRITADSTAGGGRNAPGGTTSSGVISAHCCQKIDSAPYSRPPGCAVRRSATSRWSIRTAASSAARASKRRARIGLDALYGRLPTTSTRPAGAGRSAPELLVGEAARVGQPDSTRAASDRSARRLGQPRLERGIDLEGDQASGARGEGPRQGARAGADLAHDVARGRADGLDDALRHAGIGEEVLAERAAPAAEVRRGSDPVPRPRSRRRSGRRRAGRGARRGGRRGRRGPAPASPRARRSCR